MFGGSLLVRNGLWTPSKLNPLLWFDANDSSTLTINGGTVSVWNDKSNNQNDLIQDTLANRPQFSTATFGGRGSVLCDSSVKFMQLTSLAAMPDEASLFFVVDSTNISEANVYKTLMARNSSAPVNTPQSYIGSTSGGTGTRMNCFWGGNRFAPTFTSQGLDILEYQHKVGTGILFGKNGITESISILSQTLPIDSVWTGLFTSVGSQNAIGLYMGEVVIAGVITTEERDKINGYLAHKWGLTANLPVNHPFKNSPP